MSTPDKIFVLTVEVKEAVEKLDMMHLNRKEREFYEADLKALRDWAEALRTAEEKGEKNKAIEMARNLKQNGVDISLIAGASGLTRAEIEKL